jgi:hypothetical protein
MSLEKQRLQKSYAFYLKMFARANYTLSELFTKLKEFQSQQARLENSLPQVMALNFLIDQRLEIKAA